MHLACEVRSHISVDTGGTRLGEGEGQDHGMALSWKIEAVEDPARESAGRASMSVQGHEEMARGQGSGSSSFNSVGLHNLGTSEVTPQHGLLWKEKLLDQSRELHSGTHQPPGFKKARGPLSLALAQTFTTAGTTTMQDVHETRKRCTEARNSTSLATKKSYLEYLERSTPSMMNADLAVNTRQNWGVAANAWADFVEATGIAPFMPYVPDMGHTMYNSTVEYIKKTYTIFIRHQLDVTKPKDGILGDPETAISYAATIARAFERIGLDHITIIAPVLARARSGANRLSVQIRGPREKIKKAAFPIEMVKKWFEDVDEDAVQGSILGTILTMIQYATQVGPRRSEYTEGERKFDPLTDLTRGNLNYYVRDENGVEVKLVPTQDQILRFLDTIDLDSSRAGVKPPLMKNDQFGKRMGRWETPIPLNREWLCAARWLAKMEIADPVPLEERDRTVMFRHPGSMPSKPVKTYTLDKSVINLISEYYKENNIMFDESEVRKVYSLHSFRVLATNLLLKAGAPRHVRKMLGRWSSDEGMDTYTREELEMMTEFMRRQSKQVLRSYQVVGATTGILTAGGIKGVSRGPAMDSVDFGPVRVSEGVVLMPQGGQLKQVKPKGNRDVVLFDIDTNIRPESSEDSKELRNQGQELAGVFSETENQLVSIASGKTIYKEFEEGTFKGRVTNDSAVRDDRSGEIHMMVEYDDGDREDLPLPEIFAAFAYSPREQLVKRGDKFKKDFLSCLVLSS